MTVNREQIFLSLREKTSISESLKDLGDALDGIIEHATAFLDVMLDAFDISIEDRMLMQAEAASEFSPDPELEKIEKGLETCQTPEYQAELIEKNKKEVFPHIIDFHILELLKDCMEKEGATTAQTLLENIKRHGTSIVWETISANVTRDTKRICGTIFPDAAIAAGRTLILDLNDLIVDFTKAKALKMQSPDFERRDAVASGASAPRQATGRLPGSTFAGFRPGFLNSKPSASSSNSKDAEGKTEFRPS